MREKTIEDTFWEFHAANPQVYDRVVQMARTAKARGRRKLGMKMIFEVIRWETFLRTNDADGFKLNNNYTSFYARLVMDREPDLDGIFETREQRAAGRSVTPAPIGSPAVLF